MEFNGTFLATIITFIVFVFVMNKVLYAPILGIMEERKQLIDSNYQNAQNNNTKSDELTAKKDETLNKAKDDARNKYLETINDYKGQKANILADAQNSASEELERFGGELRTLSDEVKNGLKGSMSDLANDITEKIIGYRSEESGFDNEVVDSVLWGDK